MLWRSAQGRLAVRASLEEEGKHKHSSNWFSAGKKALQSQHIHECSHFAVCDHQLDDTTNH